MQRGLQLAVAAFVLAVMVIVYAIWSGQEIHKVSPDGGVVFYPRTGSGGVNSEVIEQQQDDIQRRNALGEQQARRLGGQPPPRGVTLAGSWSGQNGLTYNLLQYGSYATIQEMSPFGVTATGSGPFDGNTFQFNFYAIDGTAGQGVLQLAGSDTLQGSFTNDTVGLPVPAVLRRE